MEPLRYNIGRTAYEVNPAAIVAIGPCDASSFRRHGYAHGYRITFEGGGSLRVRNSDAVESIGIWLGQSRFPLTTPPEPEPEPEPEIEPEPVSEPVPEPAPAPEVESDSDSSPVPQPDPGTGADHGPETDPQTVSVDDHATPRTLGSPQ